MPRDKETRQLIAAGAGLVMLAIVFVLFKLGVMTSIGQFFVSKSINHMQQVGKDFEKLQTVVKKDGERIQCKKINDQGQYWELVRTDGKVSAVKKEDVKEIVDDSAESR